jgi:hypothetical protein
MSAGGHGSCGEDRLDGSGAFKRAQFWGEARYSAG